MTGVSTCCLLVTVQILSLTVWHCSSLTVVHSSSYSVLQAAALGSPYPAGAAAGAGGA